MLFNSVEFLIFFPVVTLLYFVLPHRFRWFLLLMASCTFYMAFIPVYILILGFTIVVDYVAGIFIENAQGRTRKQFLILSLISNIGVLFIFKYYNFFNANFAFLARVLYWNYPIQNLAVILPIGLSFHTFQAMAYTIEVYRGRQKAERHFGIYALYVMFYPQLVAGPIERPQNLLRQFYELHRFDYARVTGGLKLMTWGMFLKVVIADRLSMLVDPVYNNPTHYQGLALVLATFFFTFQIYCDFAGYSYIAIGAAKVMGISLVNNFNRPYFSKSIAAFWQRWHISLSTWFRDYLYIPLGGNRVPRWRWQMNIMITFLVSGLWHGARWTFVIWGALHGFYYLISIWTQPARAAVYRRFGITKKPFLFDVFRVSVTFCMVAFAWIFFRANSLSDALYVVTHLLTGWGGVLSPSGLKAAVFTTFQKSTLAVAVLALCIMEGVHIMQRTGNFTQWFSTLPAWARWAAYYGIVFAILLFGVFNESQFIYFQF